MHRDTWRRYVSAIRMRSRAYHAPIGAMHHVLPDALEVFVGYFGLYFVVGERLALAFTLFGWGFGGLAPIILRPEPF